MKYNKYVLLLLLMIIIVGCGQINNDEDLNHLALTVAKSVVGGDALRDIETHSEYPIPFTHPLKYSGEMGLTPRHVQMTLGEVGITDRSITILLDEEVEDLTLILVNEASEEVMLYVPMIIPESASVPASGLFSYTFQLNDLRMDSHYSYGFTSDNTYTNVYAFDTWHSDEGTKLVVFGDLQGYLLKHYTGFRTLLEKMILEESPQGMMLMGDIVDTGDVNDQWDYYYTSTFGIGDHLPTLSSIGNHDVKGSRENYENTFIYPSNGLSELSKSTGYYDLPYGRVAIVDTERPSLFAEQQEWLIKVMEGYDTGSKMVIMHRSVYPIFYIEPHMQVWAEVFEKAGIDLVLSGHDHIYSRTTVNDVTYIVTGSGSGSKYYEQEEVKPWQDIIFDDNKPVSIILEIEEEGIWVKAYSFETLERLLIDQVVLTLE